MSNVGANVGGASIADYALPLTLLFIAGIFGGFAYDERKAKSRAKFYLFLILGAIAFGGFFYTFKFKKSFTNIRTAGAQGFNTLKGKYTNWQASRAAAAGPMQPTVAAGGVPPS